jgi:hypothetical protein
MPLKEEGRRGKDCPAREVIFRLYESEHRAIEKLKPNKYKTPPFDTPFRQTPKSRTVNNRIQTRYHHDRPSETRRQSRLSYGHIARVSYCQEERDAF